MFWGPAFGGAIEDWFAYMLALVFLLFRPQGPVRRAHHREGLRRCSTARPGSSRRATPPTRRSSRSCQDRLAAAVVLLAVAFSCVPLAGHRILAQHDHACPFLVYALAALGLNLLTGYAGQVSLGTGGFMAVGAFAAYKLATAFPGLNIVLVLAPRRADRRGRGHPVRLPEPADQGLLSRGRDACLAVLPDLAVQRVPWFTNYTRLGRDQRAAARGLRSDSSSPAPRRSRVGEISVRRSPWWCSWRSPPRTWCAAASGAPGWRSATWTSPRRSSASARCATKLLAFAVSSFYCGIAGALWAFIYTGSVEAARLRHRPLVPDPVHDHHRRPRQHPRLLPRRRLHRAAADLPRQRAARSSARHPRQSRSPICNR